MDFYYNEMFLNTYKIYYTNIFLNQLHKRMAVSYTHLCRAIVITIVLCYNNYMEYIHFKEEKLSTFRLNCGQLNEPIRG